MRNPALITLVLSLLAGPANAESLMSPSMQLYRQKAEQFARDRYRNARDLLIGPERPSAISPTSESCAALYARRVALIQDQLDYRATFWDDQRNRAVVFIGPAWSGAFYYLPYSALAEYSEAISGPQTQTDIDALRAASARQRCFER